MLVRLFDQMQVERAAHTAHRRKLERAHAYVLAVDDNGDELPFSAIPRDIRVALGSLELLESV